MHIAAPDSSTLQHNETTLTAHLQTHFPSTSQPAILAVTAPAAQQRRVRRQLERPAAMAAARSVAHAASTTSTSRDATTTSAVLPLTGLGDNGESRHGMCVVGNGLIAGTL